MNVAPETLLPSQDFLKPNTVKFILECFAKGELDQLPPSPIVRQDDNGNLIAIDGHNLIAVKVIRKEPIEVHIATSSDDGLTEKTDADITRNKDLKDKYDSVLNERSKVQAEGINTFEDLIARYPELFNN